MPFDKAKVMSQVLSQALSRDLNKINAQYTQEDKNPEHHRKIVLLKLDGIRKLLKKAQYEILHGVLDYTKRYDEYLQDFGEKLTKYDQLEKLISVNNRLINLVNEERPLCGVIMATDGSFF